MLFLGAFLAAGLVVFSFPPTGERQDVCLNTRPSQVINLFPPENSNQLFVDLVGADFLFTPEKPVERESIQLLLNGVDITEERQRAEGRGQKERLLAFIQYKVLCALPYGVAPLLLSRSENKGVATLSNPSHLCVGIPSAFCLRTSAFLTQNLFLEVHEMCHLVTSLSPIPPTLFNLAYIELRFGFGLWMAVEVAIGGLFKLNVLRNNLYATFKKSCDSSQKVTSVRKEGAI